MAIHNNLDELFTGVADAIRAKTGKTESIIADEFPEYIENIPTLQEAYAMITVTYPEGATLSCSNGTENFIAENTSGSWIFIVPSAGTWTVTLTNDITTITKEVIINTKGQSESIILAFELVLFDNGAYDEVTGGFTNIQDTELVAYATTTSTSGAAKWTRSNNLIDFSNYTTLHFTVTAANVGQYSNNKNRKFGLVSAVGGSTWLVSQDIANGGTGTFTIDISDVDSAAIALYAQCWSNVNNYYNECSLSINKIWAT